MRNARVNIYKLRILLTKAFRYRNLASLVPLVLGFRLVVEVFRNSRRVNEVNDNIPIRTCGPLVTMVFQTISKLEEKVIGKNHNLLISHARVSR
jgi:hypothetical protein